MNLSLIEDVVPDITVAVLVHNREDMVARSIRSILASRLHKHSFELLVIDDGSTDNTQESLRPFYRNLVQIKHETNRGVGFSSNEAVSYARGGYFIRVDSDDFISGDLLNFAAQILDNKEEIGIVSCDFSVRDRFENAVENLDLASFERMKNFGAGFMFRRGLLEEVGNYNPVLRHGEDLDMNLRLEREGVLRFHIPVPLYRRRIHASNLSASHEDKVTREEIRENHDRL